ncbi:MAG TPA: hypothetical protein VFC19_28080 [Candidatus Limnocylindrales bacterium]|nr:hypothetical protein [Candidatus Limnocylindrales bacterium]
MPGQRIANAAAALLATGSMVIGQPITAQAASPSSESFVEILTGPGDTNGYNILPSTNCGCGCRPDVDVKPEI